MLALCSYQSPNNSRLQISEKIVLESETQSYLECHINYSKIEIIVMSNILLKVWRSSSKTTENPQKPNKQNLPNDICRRILDLQFETYEQSVKKETVVDLLNLYSQAVEFYEERENLKYKSYQKRMQVFLKRTDIHLVLKGKQGQFQVHRKKESHRAEVDKAIKSSKVVAYHMIEGTEFKAKLQKSIIKETLDDQENQLKERMVQRRRTASNKSTFSNPHIEDDHGKQEMSMKILLRGIELRQNKKVFI